MIQITKREDHISIKGHSGYEVSGKDIVCASVSTIAITTINAIIRLDNNSIQVVKKDGDIQIDILKHNPYIDTLIENMMDLFQQLEQQYQKYVKIIK